MTSIKRTERCRVCGSKDLVQTLDLGDQALTGVFPKSAADPIGSGPLELVWCRDCTLLQMGSSYDPGEMYGANYGYRSGLNKSMVEHLGRKARALETLVGLNGGDTVLDIGSNDGTLLASYKTPGLNLIGIDPTAEKFRRYYPAAATVVPDFFSATTFRSASGAKARIITSISMFYDLEDPPAFVHQVVECLAPDGVWHLEQSYMPSMLRTTSYDTVCHEHLEYYTLGVVDRMLKTAGLEIADVGFNQINGGSFAVTACRQGAPYRRRPELVQWLLKQEERMGLHTPAPYQDFQQRVIRHRDEFRDLLRALRRGGARIMAQGASTKGNVLLQFCGIGPEEIEAIGEVNPDKFGCVTPGSNIPIIPEAEVRAAKPDYVVVLPWHFRDTFIAREAEYLNNGGRLIFPLPEIEIFGY